MHRALRQFIVASSLLGVACASREDMPQTPAATQPSDPAGPAAHQHAMPSLPATSGPGFTVADVRFMQNMIGHHAQAITMAALAPGRGASDLVLRLAQKIDISQRDEIVMMKDWLQTRSQT